MHKPRIAVLLSAHNGAAFVDMQLRSLFVQETAGDLTIFVRDDGSSDDTVSIVERYADRDLRIRLYQEPHLGYVGSFLDLVRIVSEAEDLLGEFDYFAFCDQDDVWLPGKLSAAIKALSKEECGRPLLWACRSMLADETLRPLRGGTQRNLRGISFYNTMVQNIAHGHNQVLNRALFLKLCREELELSQIYAHDMWIMNLAAVYGQVIFEDMPRTLYRQHRGNELGFGKGKVSWALARIQRARGGELRQIVRQMWYFTHVHGRSLTREERREILRFFTSQGSLSERLRYALRMKFYRQRISESIAMRVMYVLGMYRP